jgi:L-ascorbate metabolism protein UlaG (beta-lactamase superfamily)
MKCDELTMTYVGGPTALLEVAGLRLLTDPTFDPAGGTYTAGPVTLRKLAGPAVSPDALGRIDLVLLSHDHHFDNLDHLGRALLPRAGRILTTPSSADRLGGNAVGLAPWQSSDLPTRDGRIFRVTATPARHGPAGGDRGPVTGFVLAVGGGVEDAIYVSGDTVWYDGVAEVARRFQIDTAVLFMGAARVREVGPHHVTMTAEEGVEAARVFPKATIVPLHFEGWAHFTESRETIVRAFATVGLDARLHWPEPGVPTVLRSQNAPLAEAARPVGQSM